MKSPTYVLIYFLFSRGIKSRESYIASIKLEDVTTPRTRRLRKRQRICSSRLTTAQYQQEPRRRTKIPKVDDEIDTSNNEPPSTNEKYYFPNLYTCV